MPENESLEAIIVNMASQGVEIKIHPKVARVGMGVVHLFRFYDRHTQLGVDETVSVEEDIEGQKRSVRNVFESAQKAFKRRGVM